MWPKLPGITRMTVITSSWWKLWTPSGTKRIAAPAAVRPATAATSARRRAGASSWGASSAVEVPGAEAIPAAELVIGPAACASQLNPRLERAGGARRGRAGPVGRRQLAVLRPPGRVVAGLEGEGSAAGDFAVVGPGTIVGLAVEIERAHVG